ncbi:MAG: NUDIX hydrolase [Rhodospirillales bacterium]|nr:NUDIX hydrolase [Rhodospirillales bacterium]
MVDDREPRGPINRSVPPGDNRERLVCNDCGFILYANPKVVVGSVAQWDGRILLGRRAIEPRSGFWTLPAGYLENGETTERGALREAREETGADLRLDRLLAVYNIPRIGQVQVIYAASLLSPEIAARQETLEVGLFAWDDVPWQELAFPSVHWALNHWREAQDTGDMTARTNPPGDLGEFAA